MIRQINLLVICITMLSPSIAQEMADKYYDPVEMAKAREQLRNHHGGQPTFLVMGERVEYQSHEGESLFNWDAQAWYGNDLNKFWMKSEGEYFLEEEKLEEFELQGLYSRAISPFWDLQAGVRHDVKPDPSRTYGVIGLQGLAPYWFEIDVASFISNKGDVSFRLEGEYEIRIRQKLILQPRIEANFSLSNDVASGIGSGVSSFEAGFRLRYEITKEIAPYLGINWSRAFGETADIIRAEGEENENLSLVAGIRFWY
ncbi:MAG: copper resistance protein B [Pseudomonadales bacterium]|nr:copper resistance protein B [Pseudomonadales bacterium]